MVHPRLETKLNNLDIPNNSTSLYHTNIRSLPKHYDELLIHLQLFKRTPDIITPTDTYLKDNIDTDPANYPIPGYTTTHKKDVTVYIKTNIKTTKIDDITIPRVQTTIIQIHASKPTHTIINIYSRPNNISETELIKGLQHMIDEITTRDPTTNITILGDLNTDILNLTRQFYHFLVENNLHTTIITPTRHDPVHIDTATAIDVTLTTITSVNITAGTILPPINNGPYTNEHNFSHTHDQNDDHPQDTIHDQIRTT